MAELLKELKERLLARIVVSTNDCWEWQGSRVTGGYGNLTFKGKSLYTHRASWEVHNGPIPKGQFVLHTCDNRCCINPEHLFLGTQQDNITDMYAKGRDEQDYKRVLNIEQVKEIKYFLSTKRYTQQHIADMYGVSRTTILSIHLGHNWPWVDCPNEDPTLLKRA